MGLGNNLFNARKKSDLSQEEVAEKLGVSLKCCRPAAKV